MGHILAHPLERRLTNPVHLMALGYWMRCRRTAGRTPGRKHIDPIDIPGLLPWVNLIDVHRRPSGLAFRHRLIGTGIVDIHDRDSTGLWFHELYEPAALARLCRGLEDAVRTGEPSLIDGDLSEVGKPHWKSMSLIMPLASDGRSVDMLLSVSQYD